MNKPHSEEIPSPWLSTFRSHTELVQFGDNAIGLFALALRFGVEDLETTAAEAITDGSNDKKCDLIYIDTEQNIAVIAQCQMSGKTKASADANKASDLSTAVNWLLLADLDTLPDRIRSHAAELRHRIKTGEIGRLHVWFVHNLPESKNVQNELTTVEHALKSALSTGFADAVVNTSILEVGCNRFEDWYADTQSPILVNGDYTQTVDAGFEVAGTDWDAYVTAFPIRFLRREYNKHGIKLFSANVRDYLGSINSDANINYGIKKTAESEPENFWPYNNGLTILVNGFSSTKTASGKIKLKFSGMSIVNGAQTTGALATLANAPPVSAKVAVRLIKTENQSILYNIIRYNNSQNKVAAADFRSTDQTQKRLRAEMSAIPSAEYDGGRRGGLTDAIKRRPNLLASGTVGQALAALHGDATVAYNQKSDIWSNDTLYSKYFNEHTTAAHIIFAYSLLRSVEAKKSELMGKSRTSAQTMTDSENAHLAFFRRRGATFLFVAAVSACLEIVLAKKIPNLFRLSFGAKSSPSKSVSYWDELVDLYLPLCGQLEDAFTTGLQNQERLRGAILKFKSLVEVMSVTTKDIHKKFAKQVTAMP